MDISNSVDRRNEILALIQANGRVYVNELADKFGFRRKPFGAISTSWKIIG